MTSIIAAELGWTVQAGLNGLRNSTTVWRLRHKSWDVGVTRTHPTEASALAEIAERVASELRISVEELCQLLRVLRPEAVAA
jgi:SH3-like domain-containing protein